MGLYSKHPSSWPVAGSATTRWSAKVLTGSAQPRTLEEHAVFLMSAFDPEDVFDFSNPGDVEEFDRLYRTAK